VNAVAGAERLANRNHLQKKPYLPGTLLSMSE
jgi:hypothetical protein